MRLKMLTWLIAFEADKWVVAIILPLLLTACDGGPSKGDVAAAMRRQEARAAEAAGVAKTDTGIVVRALQCGAPSDGVYACSVTATELGGTGITTMRLRYDDGIWQIVN